MRDLPYLQIRIKMPSHNVGWLFLCICVIGNVMAIDLTRLYGLHNKRETSPGKYQIKRFCSILYILRNVTLKMLRESKMNKINSIQSLLLFYVAYE